MKHAVSTAAAPVAIGLEDIDDIIAELDHALG